MFGSIKSADLVKATTTLTSGKKPGVDGIGGVGFVDNPVSNVRKIIAQRLLESKQVNRECFFFFITDHELIYSMFNGRPYLIIISLSI